MTTGITVSYIEQGDPAGLPVLLLHGITDSWHSFESVLPMARVNAPTLIVWGDQDSMVAHRDTERLLNGIRGAKLLTYEGTGHTPHWEEPERFVADLKAFVQKLA
ncbi:MAG TPA: alpha/beta hydrolase [Candidatus Acidoferrales bacterium]